MTNFSPAFEKMIRNEGGYVLHEVKGDRGGQTYAGVARKFHPNWGGWSYIDQGDTDNPALSEAVRAFYEKNFWDRIKGAKIKDQNVAETIFDFAVNAGVKTASKLVQLVVGAVPDGIIGPNTIERVNKQDPEVFILKYALTKVTRYAEICNRNRSQNKFLLGWINRTIKGLT
ncbi:hypothetical protein MNBD_NITROSPIRAE01-400 [hydrothermal vent metagenome]|uniref:Uncharacterized protein n=1 Tax=hydrothermal vent metagenome TaxID=652676 RepID=A0A3B1CSE7_9ZZZZ